MKVRNLSFTTMATPEWSARKAIEHASLYGYKGIDLRMSDFKGEIKPGSSVSGLQEIRNILNNESIILAGLLCYNKTGNENKFSWKDMEDSVLYSLETACKLGARSIRIFAGNPHGKIPFDEYTKYAAETILLAIERLGESMKIVIQNHDGSYNALELVKLVKLIGNKRIEIAFSPDHSFMAGEQMAQVYSEVKPYLGQLYISDVIPLEGNVKKFQPVLPGRGRVPLKEAYEMTTGDGFDGFISFKWEKLWHDDIEEPETALPCFIKYWENITGIRPLA